jgi:hypothetical protein
MADHRIPIREPRPGPVPVPVEVVAPQPTREPRLPLSVWFRFRGRVVLCSMVWNDADQPVAILFVCPLCGQRRLWGGAAVVSVRHGLSTPPFRCGTPGCRLFIEIERGAARELAG